MGFCWGFSQEFWQWGKTWGSKGSNNQTELLTVGKMGFCWGFRQKVWQWGKWGFTEDSDRTSDSGENGVLLRVQTEFPTVGEMGFHLGLRQKFWQWGKWGSAGGSDRNSDSGENWVPLRVQTNSDIRGNGVPPRVPTEVLWQLGKLGSDTSSDSGENQVPLGVPTEVLTVEKMRFCWGFRHNFDSGKGLGFLSPKQFCLWKKSKSSLRVQTCMYSDKRREKS